MMGRQTGDQSQLFYLFNLEERIPARHLLRRINPIVAGVLADLREKLKPFYSEIGRPSIDPELMLRMLIVGYCYGIRARRDRLVGARAPDARGRRVPRRSQGRRAHRGSQATEGGLADRARQWVDAARGM
jgi:hypothetical protein